MSDCIHQHLEHIASGASGFFQSLELPLSFEWILPLEVGQP
jgi:hypothetical protein